MDKTADKFVNYAAGFQHADLTPEAIHAVKRSFVDSIGCVYGTFNDAPLQATRRLAAQFSAVKPVGVLGTEIKTSPDMAAFVNGGMIRYGDFSDDYFGLSGDNGPHPSDNIGGVLAATQWTGGDGRLLVLGIALAYEACGQITDQCSMSKHGWYYSIHHSIATSLAAGKVLGLTSDQLRHALALAVVPNVSMLQTRMGQLSNWKGFGGPNGSRNGLFAALLAKEGITGPADPFEGKAAFKRQLNQSFELGTFGGKGVPFKVEGTFFKFLPTNYSGQLPTGTALELRQQVKYQDIESIVVHLVSRYAVSRAEHGELWDPRSRETADHSLPYQIGAALVDGQITPKTFSPERFRDPAILGVVDKVRLEPDDAYTAVFPQTFNCRFEVKLKSGELVKLHRTNPKGHPRNPMSDKDIEEKFLRQAEGVLPEHQSRRLLDQLWNLEKLGDLNALFAQMVVAGART